MQPGEVIISDNCSPGTETAAVAAEFTQRLPGLRYVRQSENIGAGKNFMWLLDSATQKYFMWLADDDEFGDPTLLEKLLARATAEPDLILVFPEVRTFHDHERTSWSEGIHYSIFGKCETDWDYLAAFAGWGVGYCYYGLHEREKFVRLNPRSLFDFDLSYFNEGRLLHTLFLRGGIRFEPQATFIYDGTPSGKISNGTLLKDFTRYSVRIHSLYASSKLNARQKFTILRRISRSHRRYMSQLAKGLLSPNR